MTSAGKGENNIYYDTCGHTKVVLRQKNIEEDQRRY